MSPTISYAVISISPIFALIFTGVLLRKTAVIGPEFITTGSKLVFRIALPAMVFQKMSLIDSVPAELFILLAVFIAVTLLIYLLLWLGALRLPIPLHGSFVQGAFRGNIAIVGFDVIENAFGTQALQIAVIILMVMMPLYNILAVIVLSRSSGSSESGALRTVLLNILKNPLIWSLAAGLGFGVAGGSLPLPVEQTLVYLSRLVMPLALICIGGSLTLSGLVRRRLLWITASAVKLLLIPAAVWGCTRFFGISGDAQAALVLAAATPTAVSSFAMADAMGADSDLAGEIVSATTLFSLVTMTFWIVMLQAQ